MAAVGSTEGMVPAAGQGSVGMTGSAIAVLGVMRRVLNSGTSVVDHDFRSWLPLDRRRERAFSASFFRLEDADGHVLGVCGMWVDVTGRERARERLAILSEASARIGSSLDVMRTGQELADLAVPLLADLVTVDLAEAVPLGEEPLARLGRMGKHIPAFRRAGLASIRQGAPEALWARGPVLRPDRRPRPRPDRRRRLHHHGLRRPW
jgi:hypothetical protein